MTELNMYLEKPKMRIHGVPKKQLEQLAIYNETAVREDSAKTISWVTIETEKIVITFFGRNNE